MIRACAVLLLSALVPVAATATGAPPPDPQAWVKESNDNAKVLLDMLAKFSPESASYLGAEGHDGDVIDLEKKVYERSQAATEDAVKELKKRLDKATDASVKQDLQILIQSAEDQMTTAKLQNDLTVPYFSVERLVFGSFQVLLDPRVAKERQALALTRLRKYAGMEPGTHPVAELARARTEEKLGDRSLLRPFKGEVEQDLADAPSLIAGLKDLFAKSGLAGYEEPLAKLTAQLTAYDTWVKDTVLPQARLDSRLPPALYADSLKQYGVDIPPEELMRRAEVAFIEIQNQMRALAPLVAKAKGLKVTDYRDVIRELKKKQVIGKEILPAYEKRLATIEGIIRREGIVTLPERKAKIRLASEAESAMTPAPNMRPPQLIGNTGQYGEFLLPLVVPGRAGKESLRMDDFTHDGVMWTLTAHEARPGHELQFSAMVEKGVSIARAVFAFNSANVEGWGLYSEAELQPYMPLDGQLFALQARLQRAARAFLDPMVNLGKIPVEKAGEVLRNDVMLSAGMAQQEMDRYAFRAPGQATSYFFGYQNLMAVREKAQIELGAKFDRKAFNDFVLSQGLLPPKLLEKAVMEEFVKVQAART